VIIKDPTKPYTCYYTTLWDICVPEIAVLKKWVKPPVVQDSGAWNSCWKHIRLVMWASFDSPTISYHSDVTYVADMGLDVEAAAAEFPPRTWFAAPTGASITWAVSRAPCAASDSIQVTCFTWPQTTDDLSARTTIWQPSTSAQPVSCRRLVLSFNKLLH